MQVLEHGPRRRQVQRHRPWSQGAEYGRAGTGWSNPAAYRLLDPILARDFEALCSPSEGRIGLTAAEIPLLEALAASPEHISAWSW